MTFWNEGTFTLSLYVQDLPVILKLNNFQSLKHSSKVLYWPFQGSTSFVDILCFFCLVFAMPLCASICMCLVVTCWERANLLALICGVYLWVFHFPIGILGQVWYLIVSIPDICTLTLNCLWNYNFDSEMFTFWTGAKMCWCPLIT